MSAYKQQKRDKKKAVLANHKQRLEQEAHTQVLAWYESTGRDREARLEPSELRDLFAHVCPQAQITDMLQSLLFDAYTRRVDGTVAGAPAAPAGAGDSKLVLLPVDHVVLRYHAYAKLEGEISAAFAVFDQDHNGTLDEHEILMLLRMIGKDKVEDPEHELEHIMSLAGKENEPKPHSLHKEDLLPALATWKHVLLDAEHRGLLDPTMGPMLLAREEISRRPHRPRRSRGGLFGCCTGGSENDVSLQEVQVESKPADAPAADSAEKV